MSEIPADIQQSARKAIWDTGRGMIGRERNYLEYRVQRAIFAERKRCATIVEGWGLANGAAAILATPGEG